MVTDIVIPHDNPVTQAALQLARVFYAADPLTERRLLFSVGLTDVAGIRNNQAEIVVTVAIRKRISDRQGYVYAGVIE